MERGGDEEADDEGDDADFFDGFVAADAGGEVVGDDFVEEGDAAANGHDEEADE